MTGFKIILDDLSRGDVCALITSHVSDMYDKTPPEFAFAMDVSALRQKDISVWTIWSDEGELMGCGALQSLSNMRCEIKSMRTHLDHLRKGVAAALLQHIINEARRSQCEILSLETGTDRAFDAAIALYEKYGFQKGRAFADYSESPHNQFYHLNL